MNMQITLEKRRLNEREVDALVEEIRKFPNPLTGKKSWLALQMVYIVKNNNDLVGVCGVRRLHGWIKMGPFVVFEKYHGKGQGKAILKVIMEDYPQMNLFVGSRNPAVAKIVVSLGFHEIKNIWQVPCTIKLYLLSTICDFFSIHFIKEFIRKKPASEGPFRFFVREKNKIKK